jgi:hypothetical protein
MTEDLNSDGHQSSHTQERLGIRHVYFIVGTPLAGLISPHICDRPKPRLRFLMSYVVVCVHMTYPRIFKMNNTTWTISETGTSYPSTAQEKQKLLTLPEHLTSPQIFHKRGK